jgi:hypothetical protein
MGPFMRKRLCAPVPIRLSHELHGHCGAVCSLTAGQGARASDPAKARGAEAQEENGLYGLLTTRLLAPPALEVVWL